MYEVLYLRSDRVFLIVLFFSSRDKLTHVPTNTNNFTSINTKMGSLLTFKIKGTQGALAVDEQIQEIFTHLVSESILELRESGVFLEEVFV